MTDNLKAISDADLAVLDEAFGFGPGGMPVTAMTMKRRQYDALRERLRSSEAQNKALAAGNALLLEQKELAEARNAVYREAFTAILANAPVGGCVIAREALATPDARAEAMLAELRAARLVCEHVEHTISRLEHWAARDPYLEDRLIAGWRAAKRKGEG